MDQTPKRPRLPSHTDLKPVLDQTPEGSVTEQRRFDSPKRTTLTDLPAAHPPERKPTLSGLPAPPPLPLEHAVTRPAPADPLEKKTWRLPTPPSALAQARRTDPPPGIRVPADETRATVPPGSSLPPASLTADAASLEAVRRRAEAAESELAELKRQKRVQAEAASPASFPPAVAAPVVPVPTIVHQGVSATVLDDFKKAQTKLLLALAAILAAVAAPCALWLTNAAMQAKKDTERAQVQVTEAVKTSEVAKVQTNDASKELAELRAQRQADQLYFIAVMRKLGVHVRKPDGWPDPPTLTVTAPIRKPGQVDDGTSLTVNTPPAP